MSGMGVRGVVVFMMLATVTACGGDIETGSPGEFCDDWAAVNRRVGEVEQTTEGIDDLVAALKSIRYPDELVDDAKSAIRSAEELRPFIATGRDPNDMQFLDTSGAERISEYARSACG